MTLQTKNVLLISLAAAAFIAACGGPAPSSNAASKPAAPASAPAMPNMAATQKVEHMAQGTLNSVDPAGRVNITHGPVASANWPGMTMSFKLADPQAAADLSPGQKVEFHFTIEGGMDATVTQIKAID